MLIKDWSRLIREQLGSFDTPIYEEDIVKTLSDLHTKHLFSECESADQKDISIRFIASFFLPLMCDAGLFHYIEECVTSLIWLDKP